MIDHHIGCIPLILSNKGLHVVGTVHKPYHSARLLMLSLPRPIPRPEEGVEWKINRGEIPEIASISLRSLGKPTYFCSNSILMEFLVAFGFYSVPSRSESGLARLVKSVHHLPTSASSFCP